MDKPNSGGPRQGGRHYTDAPVYFGGRGPGTGFSRSPGGISLLRNDRGMVLLVTLAVVSILVAAALTLNRRTRADVEATTVIRDRLTSRYMADSGVAAAMAMLIKDKKESEIDSLQEDWANQAKIDGILKFMPFEKGEVVVSISDELARLQVNALVQFPEGQRFNPDQRAMWDRFLNDFIAKLDEREGVESGEIINAMKDWLDSDDGDAITGLNGAEAPYYQGLSPPYSCANGPFNHIAELALVKGVPPALFHGPDGLSGVSDYLTVYGVEDLGEDGFTFPGRINVNTAGKEVLAAVLPDGSAGLASALTEYRGEDEENQYVNDLSSPDWTKIVPGVGGLKINSTLVTTKSDFFRIRSEATLGGARAAVTAVVHREKDTNTGTWKCRVLHWRPE
ncbi:MAG: type II secretion system minor pseudopilin GspK [Desulfobacterales bacterium]|nr:type II secretion system minor pseudopilin GspK [Desulfobacterales bacterium]